MSATRSYVPRKGRFFYGYLIVAAAFVVAATAWGSNRAYGVFLAPMLYAFAALYGVSLWATGGLLSPPVAEFFGLKAHATLFGMVVLVGAIGGAVGPVAVGAIFDAAGSYTSAFVLCLAVNAASLLLVLSLFRARTWRPA